MPASAVTSWPHSITVLWQVLLSHPPDGRRLSWPEFTNTNRVRREVNPLMCALSKTAARVYECYFLDQAVYTKYLQLEKPSLPRSYRPLCGYCYLFTVLNSGPFFPRRVASRHCGVPVFPISLSLLVENETLSSYVALNFDL